MVTLDGHLLPIETSGSASRRRELLAQGWLDDAQVEEIAGTGKSALLLRRGGEILAVGPLTGKLQSSANSVLTCWSKKCIAHHKCDK